MGDRLKICDLSMTKSASGYAAIERFHERPQIRLSEKSGETINDPFTLKIYPNVLDGEFYNTLSNDFPSPDERWDKQTGLDSQHLVGEDNPHFGDIIGGIPSWSVFISYILSQEFCLELAKIIYPILSVYNEKGIISPSMPKWYVPALATFDLFQNAILERCYPFCHFSCLGSGDLNSPHSDNFHKIVSIIAYFPPPNWKQTYGGRTIFLKSKTDLASSNWYSPFMNRVDGSIIKDFHRDMEVFYKAEYKENHWTLLCKSNNSFHAISPLLCPADITRRALVFGMRIKAK